jgi:phosphomannomutase
VETVKEKRMSAADGTLMAGVSGIRGIVGRGFDPEVAADYAVAYTGRCGDGPVALARDPRESGGLIREAVIEALTGIGRTVVDLGVVPTPTLLLNAALLNVAGGIMITASHNPVEWNGLKFSQPGGGRFLSPALSMEIAGEVREGIVRKKSKAAGPGKLREDTGAAGRHKDIVASARGVNTGAVAGAGLKVVVDAGGGAASWIIPTFLEGCGVVVHPLNCDPDGGFPRPPEPVAGSLAQLGSEVVETGSDLGMALDPDGDRLALVGPDGIPAGEEVTLALAAKQVLSAVPGPVVANLSTSRMLDDVAAEAGTVCVRTPVGEINVAVGMETEDAVIGGEGNGGVIHRDVVMGRDGLTGAALILSALAEGGFDLPRLRSAIPTYSMLKYRSTLPENGAEGFRERVEELISHYPEAEPDSRDGLRLDWEDRWVHLRPSNTEPIVRVIAEAPTEDLAEKLARECAAKLDLKLE